MSHDFCVVQALSSLPHGPEFRFVDSILSLSPGASSTAHWTLRTDEHFLKGHFPGNPMLPGVVMVEAIAQLAGIIIQSGRGAEPLRDVRLTAIRQFKILGTLHPGETMEISASIEGSMGRLYQASGSITGPAGLLATGSIVLTGAEP